MNRSALPTRGLGRRSRSLVATMGLGRNPLIVVVLIVRDFVVYVCRSLEVDVER